LFDRQTWVSIFKTCVASAVMGGCILLLGWVLPAPGNWTTHFASLALSSIVGIAVYGGIARVTGAEEIGMLLRRGR
jgi:hypothetical protein